MSSRPRRASDRARAVLEALEESQHAGTQVQFVANPVQKLFIEHRPFEGFVRPADWPAHLNPRVVDLFSCRAGEGKSAGLCWSVWFYTRHNPGAHCLLLRDTWENLRDTTQKEFFHWFPDGVMGKYVSSTKTFHWNPNTGLTGEVTFLGADDEKDAGKLQSRFFGLVAIDEPSPSAGTGGISELVFSIALGRLRQKGMNWYAAKLAQNNPDETHWTYRRFVDPGTPPSEKELGYTHFQTRTPENLKNLPPGYYEQMTADLASRPDLQRRFVAGQFGFQQLGKPVCPLWNDDVHLVDDLDVPSGCEMWISWDGGHTPVCVIGLIAPSGVLLITDAVSETDGGTYQLIEDQVYPLLESRYAKYRGKWSHTGDPALITRDQSDTRQSPVQVIRKLLGGLWVAGPKDVDPGVNALNRRLSLLGPGGKGMVIVSKKRAKGIWHALRGGWHYALHPGGTTSPTPVKNHPHCVDYETEILTFDGWKRYNELQIGERVYGFAPGRGIVEDRVRAVNFFPGEREVNVMETSAVSLAVTDNHKLWTRHKKDSHASGQKARVWSELNTGHLLLVLPRDTRGLGGSRSRLSDDFVRLAAWVLTDGTMRKQDGDVFIKQFTYWDDVVELAGKFRDASVNEKWNTIRIAGDTSVLLRLLMPEKIPSGEFIRMMTPTQRRLFLYEAMRGDGTTRGEWPNGGRLENQRAGVAWVLALQADEADAVQHIATLSGFATSRSDLPGKTLLTIHRRGEWTAGRWVKVQAGSRMIVPGVWCPTTGTGWWISRRHGRVCLTGNSDYGDAMRYLAGTLFPHGKERVRRRKAFGTPGYARYTAPETGTLRTLAKPKNRLPEEFRTIP